ncbi:hypothetical protein SAMN04488136_12068 [Vibrio xiamenensis]|uniref:Uncharacterized protein n=1 Tax=Vibrio xiamenensis TaxID=861298 RepID=A0A1G8DN35_9VIBR|nr:hypothetical protein [Vibrio xiamenensis]SDH58810.1 hypothetical protein SAMN04488136_12068 [Vibrio xiamenensis]
MAIAVQQGFSAEIATTLVAIRTILVQECNSVVQGISRFLRFVPWLLEIVG